MKTLLAALLLLASAAPAAAVTYTYMLVGGTFADGGVMTGSFDYDTVTGLGDFSFSTTASGGFAARSYTNANTTQPYGSAIGAAYGFTPEGWFQIVPMSYTAGIGPSPSDGQAMDIDDAVYAGVYDGGAYRWFGAAAQIAPVPEPGEWAMMAAGLAVVAGAARHRRRKA